jgi:glycine cleavage system H protein
MSDHLPDFLETTVDKLVLRVATDRRYSAEGIWVLEEGAGRVRVGLADFPQQRDGDVAFAEVGPPGTLLAAGDELGTMETIKVNVSIPSPIAGTIREVNPALEIGPEVINKDPYGAGWLAVIETAGGSAAALLDPQAYFLLMKAQAEEAR